MTLSIRARLTIWFSALTMMALTIFSLGVLWLHARWARAQFDVELADLGAAISRVMKEELDETGNLARAAAETRESMDVPGRATAILDPHSVALVASWHGFVYDAAMLPATGVVASRFATLHQGATEWRVLRRPESSSPGDYVILVAGTLDLFERQQRLLSSIILVGTPLIVLVTAGLSWFVASAALGPVTALAGQAEAFTVRPVDWRLDAPPVDDEVGQLARAFNRLLARLEQTLQTQRRFMADASHELRTPVSVIRTAAEVTLEEPDRQLLEYREALTIVSEQSARLTRLVEDMFVLARADAGGQRLAMRPLYLDDVVDECVRAAAVVAGTRAVRLVTTLEEDVQINGDHNMLRQLFANLLDNAVRHTPSQGEVTVALQRDLDVAVVAVSDTGPGIADEDRERVFERFVRLDPARSTDSGAGLGLPIARWIAALHHGSIRLEGSVGGGCRFVVTLPASRIV